MEKQLFVYFFSSSESSMQNFPKDLLAEIISVFFSMSVGKLKERHFTTD